MTRRVLMLSVILAWILVVTPDSHAGKNKRYQRGDAITKIIVLKIPDLKLVPASSEVDTGVKITFAPQGGKTSAFYESMNMDKENGSQTFELTTNASGGSIDAATGAYIAGDSGGVTDIITVTDMAGKKAKATVTVKLPPLPIKAVISLTSNLADSRVVTLLDWPGSLLAPSQPVDYLHFIPKATMASSTVTPLFLWPDCPGAAVYKLYISKSPFLASSAIFAGEVRGTRYQLTSADGTQQLRNGDAYSFLVLPKDKLGIFLVKPTVGFYSDFKVQLAVPDKVVVPGVIDILSAKLNSLSSTSYEKTTVLDRDKAPDGTLTIAGRVSSPDAINGAVISYDNGANYVPIEFDFITGDFNHVVKLAEKIDYKFLFSFDTGGGAAIRKLPGDLEILQFVDLTLQQRIRSLLDKLRDAYLQNDRTKLVALIDIDYISTEPGFADYRQLDNSMRDQFNRMTTSTCRWSSETIEIVTPDKYLKVTFDWTQKINFTSFNESRDLSTPVTLDVRKVNGVWLIRQDLNRALFVNDFGMIPAPPPN